MIINDDNTCEIKLGMRLMDCPMCWQNFIEMMRVNYTANHEGGFTGELLNQALSLHNAMLKDLDIPYKPTYLIFASSEDKLAFLLKFEYDRL